MPNSYCNLVPTNKIKDEFAKITNGFGLVEADIENVGANKLDKSTGGTVSGDTVFTGAVTMSGSTTINNPTEATINDTTFVCNANQTGTPTLDGGVEVERGDATNTNVKWSESKKIWQATDSIGMPIGILDEIAPINLYDDPYLMDYAENKTLTDLPFESYAKTHTGTGLNVIDGITILNLDGLAADGEVTIFCLLKSTVEDNSQIYARFRDASNAYLGSLINSRKVKYAANWELMNITIPVPVGFYNLEIGFNNDALATVQLTGIHIYKGRVKPPTLMHGIKESQLESRIRNKLKDPDYKTRIMSSLQNPFVKTQIKLAGDSITAGVGGTGYSITGTTMFTDINGNTQKENVTTATCWANMLRDYVVGKYNKEVMVEVTDPGIEVVSPSAVITTDGNTILDWRLQLPNAASQSAIKFSFYGDHFSVYHIAFSSGGILDVYIDGSLWGQLDTYNSDFVYNYETVISGLSDAEHSVEIKETGTKNALSAAYNVYIEAFKIPKTATVKNWGIAGISSQYLYENRENYFEAGDTITFIQIGTNDRSNQLYPAALKGYLRSVIDYIQSIGGEVVLMSPPPVIASSDNNLVNNFKINDVNTAVSRVSRDYGMKHINNYHGFIQYCLETGVTIDSLLPDGTHPNDVGYKAIYENILKETGLSLIIDGVTY